MQAANGAAKGAATLYFRPLRPHDLRVLKEAHQRLFPIDYDDAFYSKATHGADRVFSWAAFWTDPGGQEVLAGFLTARVVYTHELDYADRQHLGLQNRVYDHDPLAYILTLGVTEGFRHQGVASRLLNLTLQQAYRQRCQAVFLHVISYNIAAIQLYTRAGFACAARLPCFYHISTGRQPDPRQAVYDALLFVLYSSAANSGALGGGGDGSSGSATPSGTGPWAALQAAAAPLRCALGRLQLAACGPVFWQRRVSPPSPEAGRVFQPTSTSASDPLLPASCGLPDADAGSFADNVAALPSPPRVPAWWRHRRSRSDGHHSPPPAPSEDASSASIAVDPAGSTSVRHRPPAAPAASPRADLDEPLVAHVVMMPEPILQGVPPVQQRQPSQQRMLRWLFRPQSRGRPQQRASAAADAGGPEANTILTVQS